MQSEFQSLRLTSSCLIAPIAAVFMSMQNTVSSNTNPSVIGLAG
jgi:hypothetical protein